MFKFSCPALVIELLETNVTRIWSAGGNTGDPYVVRATSDCVTDAKRMGPETLTSFCWPVGIGAFFKSLDRSDGLEERRKNAVGRWQSWIENTSLAGYENQRYIHVFDDASTVR